MEEEKFELKTPSIISTSDVLNFLSTQDSSPVNGFQNFVLNFGSKINIGLSLIILVSIIFICIISCFTSLDNYQNIILYMLLSTVFIILFFHLLFMIILRKYTPEALSRME